MSAIFRSIVVKRSDESAERPTPDFPQRVVESGPSSNRDPEGTTSSELALDTPVSVSDTVGSFVVFV